jgi:biopolymer transport protein ExbB/TolQ
MVSKRVDGRAWPCPTSSDECSCGAGPCPAKGLAVRYDIEVAKLAERAAAIVLRKMGRGRASLAAIASSAFFVGSLATVIGIVTSFRGGVGEKSTAMAFLAELLSEAIVPTAYGLLLAIFASWCHRYLCIQLEALDTEMRAATLEMANVVSLWQRN